MIRQQHKEDTMAKYIEMEASVSASFGAELVSGEKKNDKKEPADQEKEGQEKWKNI